MRNGISPFSPGVEFFCHVTMAIQLPEPPRMLTLELVVNLILAFCKVKQFVRNVPQGCALSEWSNE